MDRRAFLGAGALGALGPLAAGEGPPAADRGAVDRAWAVLADPDADGERRRRAAFVIACDERCKAELLGELAAWSDRAFRPYLHALMRERGGRR